MTSSPSNSSDRNPVEALAEEFLDRKRRGERPSLDEYCQRYAELAEEIRDLFPVLLQMEDFGADGSGAEAGTSNPLRSRSPIVRRHSFSRAGPCRLPRRFDMWRPLRL